MDTKDKLIEKQKELLKIFEDWLERDLVIKDGIVYFDDKGDNQEVSRLKKDIATLEKQIEEQESITDEMIEKWAKDVNQRNFSYSFYEGLIKGAKIMRDHPEQFKIKTK